MKTFNQRWQFPVQAAFGQIIPKEKIYQQVAANKALKDNFVAQVEQIRWAYKLATSTINLPGSDDVPELEVITVTLKGETLADDVLAAIDKAIPLPLFFELKRQWGDVEQIRYAAAFKRRSEADASKWVCSEYLFSEWLDSESVEAVPLPMAINLPELYQRMLANLLPIPPREAETIEQTLARLAEINSQQKKLAQLKKKVSAEKQFNRKVELNRQLKSIQQELKILET